MKERPEREQSLSDRLTARLGRWAEGRRPHKFPGPDESGARKAPPLARAGPPRVKRGLRASRALLAGSRRNQKRKPRPWVSPPRRREPEGRGAGGGSRRRAAPSQRKICFRFQPQSGEDGGRCSFGSGRKSACGGRARPGRPTRGRRPGGTRTTSPYSAGAVAAARSRLRASQAPRPQAGRGSPTADARPPARAARPRPPPPPGLPPSAPRGRGKCARAACVELPGTQRRRRWPFVYFQTEGAPVCTPPPGRAPGVSAEVALTAEAGFWSRHRAGRHQLTVNQPWAAGSNQKLKVQLTHHGKMMPVCLFFHLVTS